MRIPFKFVVACMLCSAAEASYFRYPAIHQNTIVFTAEGDLWISSVDGGIARRLTTHLGEESHAAISPDGKTVAYTARYEGPAEVYVLPIQGGTPKRLTYYGEISRVVGWTPDGRVLYATRKYSGLPSAQLIAADPVTGQRKVLPLAEAAEACYGSDQQTLFFTRYPFHNSHTKHYRGGMAQKLYRFDSRNEAQIFTSDHDGTNRNPMCWRGRLYFLSDRDGTINLWSSNEQGSDLIQHSRHQGWDIRSASLSEGRIVYQLGADLHVFDLVSGVDRRLSLQLVSDFDQQRERWVKSPFDYLTQAHLSPSGDRLILTARGQIFIVPTQTGRRIEIKRNKNERMRAARFMPDGKSIVTLSDLSGEVELWTYAADGKGPGQQLSSDGKVLRWEAYPSPDGKWLLHHDKDLQLWLFDGATRRSIKIDDNSFDRFRDFVWLPNSQAFVYSKEAKNGFRQLWLYQLSERKKTALTSDRYDSFDPVVSPDGHWLYFLSDRNLQSVVRWPWGLRNPKPYFDRQTKLYALALRKEHRFPFQAKDELPDSSVTRSTADKNTAATPPSIAMEGIANRLYEVPVAAGNYSRLQTDGKRLFWLSRESSVERRFSLRSVAIDAHNLTVDTFWDDVHSFELSQDGKKMLVRRQNEFYVFDPVAKPPSEINKHLVALRDWTFSYKPREEWRQMFAECWRLHRDYFYDRKMHNRDWQAIRTKYESLVERVTDRAELADLLAQMISELAALHSYVYGGDFRRGSDDIEVASLGAQFSRSERGYRIDKIFRSDPELPSELAPLAQAAVNAREGDYITSLNGQPLNSVDDLAGLLRNQVGKQVLLTLERAGQARDVIVTPISARREAGLRYSDWEENRRQRVEEQSDRRIGYVHLREMQTQDIAQWAREFYPVFQRQGLIIDLRRNNGGNIDSWILETLLRRAWLYWQPRAGDPYWNMQFAFRGHVVALVDAYTVSDGETAALGIQRLGIGKLIGVRTLGAQIWLSLSNLLVDNGIASAAEVGVYGPEGEWLIENHGVTPDIIVDNPPYATFKGEDAQLDAAIKYLLDKIVREPIITPTVPPYPDKL